MEKKFNRSMANEVAKKVQEALSDYFKTSDFSFTVGSGNFNEGRIRLNLDIRMKNEDGSVVVSDSENSAADEAAQAAHLKVEGHLIGSRWNVQDIQYEVVGYYPRRKRYPLSVRHNDSIKKASFAFLLRGEQVLAPTQDDFYKWFTIDPDSDAVRESDVEIIDRVQYYMENNYPVEQGAKFLSLVDKFNEKGIANKVVSNKMYQMLFVRGKSIVDAYLVLKGIYKSKNV